MSRDRRGSTHRGRPSVVADQNYEPPPDVIETHDSLVITFSGEDGRSAVFSMAGLPLPLWHPALCEAFTRRVGPAGSRRTQASARTIWNTMCRFIRFLDELPAPPATPQQLTAIQLDAYLRGRIRALRGRWGFVRFPGLTTTAARAATAGSALTVGGQLPGSTHGDAAPSVADGLLRRRILPFGRWRRDKMSRRSVRGSTLASGSLPRGRRIRRRSATPRPASPRHSRRWPRQAWFPGWVALTSVPTELS